jgi:hypothetical protein
MEVLTFGKTQKKRADDAVACYWGFGMKALKALWHQQFKPVERSEQV